MRLLQGSDQAPVGHPRRYRIGIGTESLVVPADDVVDAIQDAQQQVPHPIASIIDITRAKRRAE